MPGPSSGGGRPSPGTSLGSDYTTWDYWWEYNRHRFLGLRDEVHSSLPTTGSDDFYMGSSQRSEEPTAYSLRPTERDLRDLVLPALLRELERPDQTEVTTSALMALAKLRLHDVDVRARISKRLASPLGVVRETAALALGISRDTATIPILAALVADSAAGRRLCGLTRVDRRIRAFAAYGLGLVARETPNADIKTSVVDALRPLLLPANRDWQTKVAAIEGIRLINPSHKRSYKSWALIEHAVESLRSYYVADVGRGEAIVKSHVPVAIAQLLGRGNDKTGRFTEMFLNDLGAKNRSPWIRQSAMLALGQLCTADDDTISQQILRYFERGKDQQTRFFGLIALGQIGGDKNRTRLLHTFTRGTKHLERPWAALSLGVLSFNKRKAAADPAVDVVVGDAIFTAWLNTKNVDTRSSLSIALGLCGYSPAQDKLKDQLSEDSHRTQFAGYLSSTLALLGYRKSVPVIRRIAADSQRFPNLLIRTCTALALLKDKSIAPTLLKALDQKRPNITELAAIATSLGQVGDRTSLSDFLDILADPSLTKIGRGAAISGLGGVVDRELMPWHTAISANLNYRAGVETLSDGSKGILDIL